MKLVKYKNNLELKNGILIEGLPGIGNVARIVVDYLIDKLKAKKFLEIYFDSAPNLVFIDEDNTIELPKIELFYKKRRNKDLLLLTGDFQPKDEKDQYKLTKYILNISKKIGIKEIVTLGGIALNYNPKIPRVHGAVSHKKYIKKLKDLGVVFDGNRTVGMIVGAAGLLLGLGELEKIYGFALLGETHVENLYAIKTSREILKILVKFLNLKIDLKDLDDQINEIESERKKIIEKMAKFYKKDSKLNYIG